MIKTLFNAVKIIFIKKAELNTHTVKIFICIFFIYLFLF